MIVAICSQSFLPKKKGRKENQSGSTGRAGVWEQWSSMRQKNGVQGGCIRRLHSSRTRQRVTSSGASCDEEFLSRTCCLGRWQPHARCGRRVLLVWQFLRKRGHRDIIRRAASHKFLLACLLGGIVVPMRNDRDTAPALFAIFGADRIATFTRRGRRCLYSSSSRLTLLARWGTRRRSRSQKKVLSATRLDVHAIHMMTLAVVRDDPWKKLRIILVVFITFV